MKHRQGKNHRPRIVVFVGSPLEVDQNEFTKLAKRLKKEKVSIDIVVFGEEVRFRQKKINQIFSRKLGHFFF